MSARVILGAHCKASSIDVVSEWEPDPRVTIINAVWELNTKLAEIAGDVQRIRELLEDEDGEEEEEEEEGAG